MESKKMSDAEIIITASFTVSFTKKITKSQMAELESGAILIDQLTDDAEAYEALRDDGDCDFEWYHSPESKKTAPKKKKK